MASNVMICNEAPLFYYSWKSDDRTPQGSIKLGDIVGIVDRGQYDVMEATVIGQDSNGPFITFRWDSCRRSYDPYDIDRFGVEFYRPVKYEGTDRLVMVGDTVEVDGKAYEVMNLYPDRGSVYLKPVGFYLCDMGRIGYPTAPSEKLGVYVSE